LKPPAHEHIDYTVASHPVRVRGLKREGMGCSASRCVSHPVRVRGLKLMAGIVAGLTYPSHPVRVRGLKPPERRHAG